MTPSEYFQTLKGSKNILTKGQIKDSYRVILELAEKYEKTGQTKSLRRLQFLASILGEEEKLVDLGITTFIYRQTIEDYITEVADKAVKVIELHNYLREIPDEVAEAVEKTKDIFTEFYVVFTDYTGREERRIAEERKDKDPILFGCFRDSEFVADRFYYLGSWIDEYCDLTLDKLISDYRNKKNQVPTHQIDVPESHEELLEALSRYQPVEESSGNLIFNREITTPVIKNNHQEKRSSFFQRVKTFFSKE